MDILKWWLCLVIKRIFGLNYCQSSSYRPRHPDDWEQRLRRPMPPPYKQQTTCNQNLPAKPWSTYNLIGQYISFIIIHHYVRFIDHHIHLWPWLKQLHGITVIQTFSLTLSQPNQKWRYIGWQCGASNFQCGSGEDYVADCNSGEVGKEQETLKTHSTKKN